MTFKKIMLVTLFLLAILTLGAVSAAEDGISDSLAVDDNGEDNISSDVGGDPLADDDILSDVGGDSIEGDDILSDVGGDLLAYDDWDDDDYIFRDSPVYLVMPTDSDMYDDENVKNYDNVQILKGDDDYNFVLKIDDKVKPKLDYTLIIDNVTKMSVKNNYKKYTHVYDISNMDGHHTWKVKCSYYDKFGELHSQVFTGSFTVSYYNFYPVDKVAVSGSENLYVKFIKDVKGRLLIYFENKLVYNKTVKPTVYNSNYYENNYYYEFCDYVKYENNYSYSVVFKSDNAKKYPSFTKKCSFSYTYPFSISINDNNTGYVRYGSNVTGTIYCPNLVYTNMKVLLNNQTCKLKDNTEDSEISLLLDNLVFGKNTITASYEDKDYPRKTVTKEFYFLPEFDFTSKEKISLNDKAKLDLVLPADANGTVYVYRLVYNSTAGKYDEVVLLNETVTGGKFVHYFKTDNLINYGKCYAKYTGTDYQVRYSNNGNSQSYSFNFYTIPKITVPHKIWDKNKKPIVVEIPKNAKGRLVVVVRDNKGKMQVLYNASASGKVNVPTKKLKCGEFNLYVSYVGGGYEYNKNLKSMVSSFIIDNYEPLVYIDNPIYDTFQINNPDSYLYYTFYDFPEDVDGYALIYVDGKLLENVTDFSVYCGYVGDLPVGKHTWKVEFKGDSYYKPASATGNFTLSYFNLDSGYYSDETIDVKLPQDASGYIVLTIDDKAYALQYLENGETSIKLNNDLAKTIHNYEIRYSGDKKYPAGVDRGSFRIYYKWDLKMEYDFNYGEFNMAVECPSDATGSVKILIDGKSAGSAKISNGLAKFAKSDIPVGYHDIKVSYTSDKYSYSMTDAFKILNSYSIKSDADSSMTCGEDKKITLLLPASAKGNLIVTINGKDNPVPVTNGKAVFSLKNLNAGCYNISARYEGSYKVQSLNLGDVTGYGTYDEFFVNPKITNPARVYLGDNFTVSVKVPEGLSGKFVIEAVKWQLIGDDYTLYKTYDMEINGSTASCTIFNVTDDGLDYIVKYVGNDTVIPSQKVFFSVDLKSDIPAKFKMGEKSFMTISLPADATGSVTVIVNHGMINMTVDVEDGKAVVPLTGLPAGKNLMELTYDGNYGKVESDKSFTITKTSVDAKIDNITFNRTTTGFDVVFSQNVTGKVLVFVDKYVFKKNIADGKVSIKVNTLGYGNRPVFIAYGGDFNYSQLIKELSVSVPYPKITSKVASVVCNFGKYSVTVVGIDGKAINGTTVVFKINGKKIGSAKTNAKGVASIVIKNAPKKYVIVAEALKVKLSKKVTVKSALSLKKVNVRKYARKLVLTASLKNGKKAVAGKKLTFKFNGRKYVAKTNRKGVAKVTIKKAILKRLWVGKKVIYQVSYLKDVFRRTAKIRR